MFSKEVLNKAFISTEDWVKPLNELSKDVIYWIGSFDHGNVVTFVSYKNGVFYFSNKASIQKADYYKFENLQRAYEYFEQMFMVEV